jgi:hypothetical protein
MTKINPIGGIGIRLKRRRQYDQQERLASNFQIAKTKRSWPNSIESEVFLAVKAPFELILQIKLPVGFQWAFCVYKVRVCDGSFQEDVTVVSPLSRLL